MRVVYLAAGAGGMYCGSCMHDNRLAATLRAQGRDVVLLPLYTPLRTDEPDVSAGCVHYGGLAVYLQQTVAVFRRMPAFFHRLLSARVFVRGLGRLAAHTRPELLGPLTLSVLQGEHGRQRHELRRLIDGVRTLRPDLAHLPNLMFIGVAAALKAALRVPVLCGLTGEDIFLDRLPEPWRTQIFERIRDQASVVDGFVALTDYYARHATRHFGLPAERVHYVPMGIHAAEFAAGARGVKREFTLGYLARICPEKGLETLARAFIALRQQHRACRLRIAGYLGAADRSYLAGVMNLLRGAGVERDVEYVGELPRFAKFDFLHTLDAFSVPASYAEAKGFYALEALAAGVPVVEPAHGAYPELVAATGGGLLYPPGDVAALAAALARLMDEPTLRGQLARRGQAGVQREFTAERMARAAWRLYERFV